MAVSVETRPPSVDYTNFKGPLEDRITRDVIFLLIFLSCIAGWVALVVVVSMRGDLDRIIRGVDDYGNICGRNNVEIRGVNNSGKDLRNKRVLQRNNDSIDNCVEHCDEKHTAVLHRCVKTIVGTQGAVEGLSKFSDKLGSGAFLVGVSQDIGLAYKEIIYLSLIAVGLTALFIILLRFLSGVLIWLVIGIVVLATLAGTTYLWIMWVKLRREVDEKGDNAPMRVRDSQSNYLVFAIIASFATVILFLIILVMRKRIQLVVQLFTEACKAVAAVPLILIQPIWTFLFLCGFTVGWTYGLLWILSSGTLTQVGNFARYRKDDLTWFTFVLHIFVGLWFTQFILGCQNVVIAGAVSTWYFTRDKSELGYPLLMSTWRLIRYHLGSVALGSLIIAIIKYIRIILAYIQTKLKSLQNTEVKVVFCCVQCCLGCFEKFIKFLSSNAYIEIAIYGFSFCKSAQRGFQVMVSNALRVATINSVGDFLLFLTKVAITITVVFIGIELVRPIEGLNNTWVPVTLAGVLTYGIAHIFLSVFEMTIDTLFICFCEDCNMNDGDAKPYFMSESLMSLVDENKKDET